MAATNYHDLPKCSMCMRFDGQTCKGDNYNRGTVCSNCAKYLDNCPKKCRDVLAQNQALLVAVDAHQNSTSNNGQLSEIPEISIDYVERSARPFASGGFADVYDATWNNLPVALKLLRSRTTGITSVLEEVLHEARLAMSLINPNVVRVIGVVSIDNSKGILMEKADEGSLRHALNAANKLSLEEKISISRNIVDGLDYIHTRRMLHRDLKPENVLLFGFRPQLTAKISDFGTSKVIQTSFAKTARVGTQYYMAPELFNAPVRYGSEVDVYSLTILLFEVFSGQNIYDAYGRLTHSIQLYKAVEGGKRPVLPSSFPAELKTLVEKGWSADPTVRPSLATYRDALCGIDAPARPVSKTYPAISASASVRSSTSANFHDFVLRNEIEFDAQLRKLEELTEAYNLIDARRQVEACDRLWTSFGDWGTVTASTVRLHIQKSFVHHWFGEYSDAYVETYEALSQLYILCLSGSSVEGELVVKILRYAIQVCCLQNQEAAAAVLIAYALRHARSKLSVSVYADVLEELCTLRCFEQEKEVREFVLSARLEASADKPHVNVAVARYYLAVKLASELNYSAAMGEIEKALFFINKVSLDNVWVAICKSFKGELIRLSRGNLEEARQLQKEALWIAKGVLKENNVTVSQICLLYALVLDKLGRFLDAKVMYKKAIKAAGDSLGWKSTHVAIALDFLADLYANKLQNYQEAEKLYLQSIEIWTTVYGLGNKGIISWYERLVEIYEKWGQTDKAARCSESKTELERGHLEDKFESTSEAIKELSNEMSQLGRKQSGDELSEAPIELLKALNGFFELAPLPNENSTY